MSPAGPAAACPCVSSARSAGCLCGSRRDACTGQQAVHRRQRQLQQAVVFLQVQGRPVECGRSWPDHALASLHRRLDIPCLSISARASSAIVKLPCCSLARDMRRALRYRLRTCLCMVVGGEARVASHCGGHRGGTRRSPVSCTIVVAPDRWGMHLCFILDVPGGQTVSERGPCCRHTYDGPF